MGHGAVMTKPSFGTAAMNVGRPPYRLYVSPTKGLFLGVRVGNAQGCVIATHWQSQGAAMALPFVFFQFSWHDMAAGAMKIRGIIP